MNYSGLLALIAGAAIATQASMNARLGVILQSSLLGTAVAFAFSCLFTLVAAALLTTDYPSAGEVRSVPPYLWFSGGALAALGVGLFYYLIPKMGIGPMMSYALTGQLLVAITASHFGWFELPVKSFNASRALGVVALAIGIILINRE
ncbi:MAG: DMT family transporter [Porticoccaceae bacterium]